MIGKTSRGGSGYGNRNEANARKSWSIAVSRKLWTNILLLRRKLQMIATLSSFSTAWIHLRQLTGGQPFNPPSIFRNEMGSIIMANNQDKCRLEERNTINIAHDIYTSFCVYSRSFFTEYQTAKH
jgi:hypothetical protein